MAGCDNPAFVGSAALGRESLGIRFEGGVPQLPYGYDAIDLDEIRAEQSPKLSLPPAPDINDVNLYDDLPPTQEDRLYDVVVVGAGLSGLFTARCLQKEGLDVLVLEGRDRVGGRIYTRKTEEHGPVDMGAAYFSKSQTRVLQLIRELNLELYSLNQSGNGVVAFNGQYTRGNVSEMPSKNIFVLMDLNNTVRNLDKMSLQVPPETPWLAAKADEWDQKSVREFLVKTCWTEMAAVLIELAFTTVFGGRPDQISLLYCLHYIRMAGGCQNLFGGKESCQAYKLRGGSGLICERMAIELRGRISFKSIVSHVYQLSDHVQVKTRADKEYKAKRVIVAASPVVLRSIDFQPGVPAPRYSYLEHVPAGRLLKSVMYYDKPYWRFHGSKAEMVSDNGIVVYCLEDTKPDGTHPAIMGFLNAEVFGSMSEDDRKQRVANQYATAFDIPELANPIGYIEKSWNDQDSVNFTGACVFSLPPGFLTKNKCLWGHSLGKVHFAGTEAALTYRGYMDGAVRAGEKAAKEVLESLKIKPKNIYETDYEEIPYIPKKAYQKVLPGVKHCLIISIVIFILVVVIIIVAIVAQQWSMSDIHDFLVHAIDDSALW